MAKAKKAPTEAQIEARKKFGEQAKARAAANRQNKNSETKQEIAIETDGAPTPRPQIQSDTVSPQDLGEILRELAELRKMVWSNNGQQQQPQNQGVSLRDGRLIGTVEKYDLNAAVYPDPIDRLINEPRLARFAFDINYDLNFDVGISEYTTIDGIRTKEPKFTLELVGKVIDEETGEVTGGRYIISRLIMHEDPEAALVIAREQKLEVDEANEEAFLNEMRYIRMRDWLVKCFYPERSKPNNRKNEMVIGGKIVEYYEITAEEAEETVIPFDKLSKQRML